MDAFEEIKFDCIPPKKINFVYKEGRYFSDFYVNPFSTGKIEKIDFWDSNISTKFKHQ